MTCNNESLPDVEGYGYQDLSEDLQDAYEAAGAVGDLIDPIRAELETAKGAMKGLGLASTALNAYNDPSPYNLAKLGYVGLAEALGGVSAGGIAYATIVVGGALPFLGTGAIALLTVGAIGLGGGWLLSVLAEEIYEEQYPLNGEFKSFLHEFIEDHFGDATNGSDPSDCPDNAGQSGMGGPFGNGPNTPLVLDMDGDGVELISLENSHTLFDIDNDNFAERTGWVGPDDALLAIDLNANGTIDDHSELFGEVAGTNIDDGFEKLTTYDSNADNQITSADAQFSNLRVWKDAEKVAA